MEYIALIHKNADSAPTSDEWDRFFELATATGMFRGGSEIGARLSLGMKQVEDSTLNLVGFMRFEAYDSAQLKELLLKHPVIQHGGTIELCEMPQSPRTGEVDR
ncbi:hypothetical protein KOR34_32630 [Posidoniimonas corsicana]|uniref:YCII-related domain-containing protein n=1 Tax=Posidoniimonas corsicana TaxID=1938618 RepID=A0A5C5VI27_9BACT|nr:hypothetical protein [Posidoniimonas corsicana]TWT38294.1 hypothetical protein KOR34_32630 [Posidoniimonas corsicana]